MICLPLPPVGQQPSRRPEEKKPLRVSQRAGGNPAAAHFPPAGLSFSSSPAAGRHQPHRSVRARPLPPGLRPLQPSVLVHLPGQGHDGGRQVLKSHSLASLHWHPPHSDCGLLQQALKQTSSYNVRLNVSVLFFGVKVGFESRISKNTPNYTFFFLNCVILWKSPQPCRDENTHHLCFYPWFKQHFPVTASPLAFPVSHDKAPYPLKKKKPFWSSWQNIPHSWG